MRVVIGMQSFAGQGGTESYVVTVADELQRTGHDVHVYAGEDGPLRERLERYGLRPALGEAGLPAAFDVAYVQDLPTSYELSAARPGIPQAFGFHSIVFDVQLPPQLPEAIQLVVSLYRISQRRILGAAEQPPVLWSHQPVDLSRFRPRGPIGERPRRAAMIGNYLSGERRDALIAACEQAGIELELYGALEARSTSDPENVMNAVDVVFGKARVVMEAMACGRAAFVYDEFGTDGWVTPEKFEALVETGMAGSATALLPDADSLAAELAAYDQAMGGVNRDLAAARLSKASHVSELAEALRVVAETGGPVPRNDAASELARLSRVSWRHESRAFDLDSQLRERGERIEQLTREVEMLDGKLAEVVNSKRWTTLNKLLGPLDRLRGRG